MLIRLKYVKCWNSHSIFFEYLWVFIFKTMSMKSNLLLQIIVFMMVYVGISVLFEGFSVVQLVEGLLAAVIYGLLMYGISQKQDK